MEAATSAIRLSSSKRSSRSGSRGRSSACSSMSEVWSAEEKVDGERARRLIRAQLELAADEVALVSEGWDYAVFRVDCEWAFRFPRREVVVPGTEREIAVLPAIAERLSIAVPAPVFVGRPGDDFPWPFYGARYLDGVEATGARSTRWRWARRYACCTPLRRSPRWVGSCLSIRSAGWTWTFACRASRTAASML